MTKLRVQGVPPYDGEYDLPTSYTNGELHRIKQICGVPAGKLMEATQEGDVGVLVALATVILERAGHQVNVQALWDATGDNFDIDTSEEADKDRPPAEATAGGQQNEPGAVAEQNEATSPSGELGTADGENSQETPPTTGLPGSEMSAVSGQPI